MSSAYKNIGKKVYLKSQIGLLECSSIEQYLNIYIVLVSPNSVIFVSIVR